MPAALARLPEALVHALEEGSAAEELLAAASVVAVGPGLGQGEWGRSLLERAVAAGKPLVLDADALNLLVALAPVLPEDCILTPHPGETSRLLGCSTADVQRDRYAAARQPKPSRSMNVRRSRAATPGP